MEMVTVTPLSRTLASSLQYGYNSCRHKVNFCSNKMLQPSSDYNGYKMAAQSSLIISIGTLLTQLCMCPGPHTPCWVWKKWGIPTEIKPRVGASQCVGVNVMRAHLFLSSACELAELLLLMWLLDVAVNFAPAADFWKHTQHQRSIFTKSAN